MTLYGWIYLPATPQFGDRIGVTDDRLFDLWYHDGWTSWIISHASDQMPLFGPEPGWVWVAFVYSHSSLTVYWRRAGHWGLVTKTIPNETLTSWSYDDSVTLGFLGDEQAGWGGDAQYWGIYAGELTKEQLLEQSYATTQLVPGWAFWPLVSNGNTDTVGGHDMTLDGTAASTNQAPTGNPGSPNPNLATRFTDFATRSDSVFANSNDITISFWVKLPLPERNSYIVNMFKDEVNSMLVCVQHNSGAQHFDMNIMSGNGPSNNYDFAMLYIDCTIEQASDWVFAAWTLTVTVDANGNPIATTYRTYQAFKGEDLQLRPSAIHEDATLVPHHYEADYVTNVGRSGPEAFYYLQHVRIHPRVLSLDELQALMNSSEPDTSAWADWPLYDGSPEDVSGNHRDLIMSGDVMQGDFTTGPFAP